TKRIGVLGAGFNPPTKGHADVIAQCIAHFDEILLVPAAAHPFGKSLVPFAHRIAMLNCFVTSLAPSLQKKVTIDPIEQTLLESEPNKQSIYTYDVLSALEARYKEDNTSVELYFIIGPDNAAPEIWQKFYQH